MNKFIISGFRLLSFAMLIAANHNLSAQNTSILTQTIRGHVVDKETQVTLPGATVVVLETDLQYATTTDGDGYFSIKNVPVGRYSIKVSFIGYEDQTISQIQVTTSKEVGMAKYGESQ